MLTNYTLAQIEDLRQAPGFGMPRHNYILTMFDIFVYEESWQLREVIKEERVN